MAVTNANQQQFDKNDLDQLSLVAQSLKLSAVPDDGYAKEYGSYINSHLQEFLKNAEELSIKNTPPPRNPVPAADVLARDMVINMGLEISEANVGDMKKLIKGAGGNIESLDNVVDANISVQQAEITEKKQEFAALGMALGVIPKDTSGEINYTADLGQKVISKLEDELSKSGGVGFMGATKNPEADLADKLARSDVFESSKASPDARYKFLSEAMKDVYSNVEFLDSTVNPVNDQDQKQTQVETKTVTKIVPEKEIPADVRAAVQSIRDNLTDIVNGINEDDDKANLPLPGKGGGVPDAQFFESYQATLAYVTKEAIGIDSTRIYKPELRNAREMLGPIPVGPPLEYQLSRKEKTEGGAKELFDNLDIVYKAGFLKSPVKMVEKEVEVQAASSSVVDQAIAVAGSVMDAVIKPAGAGSDKPPAVDNADKPADVDTGNTNTDNAPAEIKSGFKKDINALEMFLYEVGKNIDDLPGFEGMIDSSGIAKTVFDTSKIKFDGNLDAHEQDLAAKLIMGMKKLAGEGNPDGSYSKSVGDRLKLAVLTKPSFSFIRDMEVNGKPLNIGFYGDSKENIQRAKELLAFEGDKPELKDGATKEEAAQYKKDLAFYKEYKSISGVKTLFSSMDVIAANGLYDNKKAKETNSANLMMDLFVANADEYGMGGFKSMISDFFQNSDMGKSIAKLLLAFLKVDVSRLWGEKATPEDEIKAVQDIGDDLEAQYKEIEKANPDLSFADKMAKAKEAFSDDHNGMIKQFSLKVFGGYKNTELLNAAVDEALKATEGTTNIADAKAAFVAKATELSQAFDSGKEFKIGSETFQKDVVPIDKVIEKQNQNQPVNDAASTSKSSAADIAYGKTIPFSEREVVDKDTIITDNQKITLNYAPDPTKYNPDPLRHAPLRTAELAEIFERNHDAMDMSKDLDALRGNDGEFTQMFTPPFSAYSEELLIRAQIHKIIKDNGTITTDQLSGVDRDFTPENIGLIKEFMIDKGADLDAASKADIEVDANRVAGLYTNMLNDYYSTDKNDPKAGDRQSISLLEQVYLPNQHKMDLRQFVPKVDKLVDIKLPPQTPIKDYDEPQQLSKEFSKCVANLHEPPNSFVEIRPLPLFENLDSQDNCAYKHLADFVDKEFKVRGVDIRAEFEKALPKNDYSSQYVILELEKFGIHHDDIDVVVALKHANKIEYRFIDYGDDNVKRLANQRDQGFGDMEMRGNPEDTRRLDDILDTVKDVSGGKIIQGPAGGYSAALSLVPHPYGGVQAVNAMEGVYGEVAVDPRFAMKAVNIYAGNGKYPPPYEGKISHNADGHHAHSHNHFDNNDGQHRHGADGTAHNHHGEPKNSSRGYPHEYRGGYSRHYNNDRGDVRNDNGKCGDGVRAFGEKTYILNNPLAIIGKVMDNFNCNGSNSDNPIDDQINDVTGHDPRHDGNPYHGHEDNYAPVYDKSSTYSGSGMRN